MEGYVWSLKEDTVDIEFLLHNKQEERHFKGFKMVNLDHSFINLKPPTLIKTNEFSKPYQDIVDTYGIPNYKEINPGLFTVVTFPFLFGVMFGDVGHGLLLLSFALTLYMSSSRSLEGIKSFRSLLLLMGIFATFCGFIYNEFFAVPLVFFKSCYFKQGLTEFERRSANCVYPIGLDYVWEQSSNSVGFTNSFKMKLSIVIGVIHMMLGIILKGVNALYFRKFLDFFFEFLPQVVFMLSTFGYMVFCIVIKWLTIWPDPSKAPSIITLFINFVTKVDEPLYHSAGFQLTVQRTLALSAVICIPLMLFFKPLLLQFSKPSPKHSGTNRRT